MNVPQCKIKIISFYVVRSEKSDNVGDVREASRGRGRVEGGLVRGELLVSAAASPFYSHTLLQVFYPATLLCEHHPLTWLLCPPPARQSEEQKIVRRWTPKRGLRPRQSIIKEAAASSTWCLVTRKWLTQTNLKSKIHSIVLQRYAREY